MKINRQKEEENKRYIKDNYCYNYRNGIIYKNNLSVGYLDKGYLRIKINNRFVYAHRIAWFLYYGKFPDKIIDHINQNKSDNRIKNLKLVTENTNSLNSIKFKRGCYFNKKENKWLAKICINNISYRLGSYKTEKEASLVYFKALKEYEKTNQIPTKPQFLDLKLKINKDNQWKHCRKTYSKYKLLRGVKIKNNINSIRYEAYIDINCKRKYLGSSNTMYKAHELYLNAMKNLY